jgi:hypothetical protein
MDKDDEQAVTACMEVVGRTGATDFQIGYLEDSLADWYAHAQYRGARITVEGHASPVAACNALVERLLNGAQCQHCKGAVTTTPAGLLAFDGTLTTGEAWTAEQQARAGLCVWQRKAERWVRGCA